MSSYVNDYAPGVVVPNYFGHGMPLSHPPEPWSERARAYAHHAVGHPVAANAKPKHHAPPAHGHAGKHYATPVVEYTSIHHDPHSPAVAHHEHGPYGDPMYQHLAQDRYTEKMERKEEKRQMKEQER